MDRKTLQIKVLLEKHERIDLKVRLVAGSRGLAREITVRDINRPGLSLAGFYDFFAYERVQLFGLGETAYLQKLTREERLSVYQKFFSYDINCCIFTHGVEPDSDLIAIAEEKDVPVLVTERDTTRFAGILNYILDDIFAENISLHGTLVDVYGIGVMLMGKSGVGKSECALELIERGHRLVADDLVDIKKTDETILMGSGSPILKHHMEIRGLGIINVKDIFGIRSVRNKKRIELVVNLEEWDNAKVYDRLGLDESKYPLLDIDLPYILVPVRPGRNIPIIIETAALNQRLKKMGIFTARELDKKLQNWLTSESSADD
jgi:HPr kinase/phosphorylase